MFLLGSFVEFSLRVRQTQIGSISNSKQDSSYNNFKDFVIVLDLKIILSNPFSLPFSCISANSTIIRPTRMR